jgi:A/G-specific adenine glycosylase
MFFIKKATTFVKSMSFSNKITDWYAANKRDLPWRTEKKPYQIWLSEIILQQTRVAQGLPYYNKFFEHFPTISSFAKADIEDILLHWQGLGYYSRGRNMHFAANQVMNEFDGEFPKNFKDLKKLKGVGDYTAAAIASIVFNEKVAVVDGNVYRVLSRYFEDSTPIDSTEGKKLFNQLANEIITKNNPGDHNQAVMELGALVCSPKNPDCENCPLNNECKVAFSDRALELPVKIKKIKVKERFFNYVHLTFNDDVIIHKRGGNDIWEGLYQFPLLEGKDLDLNEELTDLIGLKQDFVWKKVNSFKHILTHQRIFADFYQIELQGIKDLNEEFIAVPFTDLDNYAKPKLMVNYIESINKN